MHLDSNRPEWQRAMVSQNALYRYFDAADRLLYIGKSGNVAARNSGHIKRSEWIQFAVRSAFERFPTPEELVKAEREAIEAEGPVFNIQYNDTPKARNRLRAYLEEAGRPDLIPKRLRPVVNTGPVRIMPAKPQEDKLDLLWQILTADTADHSKVRLWAVAAFGGYSELPGGEELERLCSLSKVAKSNAYRIKKASAKAAS